MFSSRRYISGRHFPFWEGHSRPYQVFQEFLPVVTSFHEPALEPSANMGLPEKGTVLWGPVFPSAFRSFSLLEDSQLTASETLTDVLSQERREHGFHASCLSSVPRGQVCAPGWTDLRGIHKGSCSCNVRSLMSRASQAGGLCLLEMVTAHLPRDTIIHGPCPQGAHIPGRVQ